MRWGLPGAALMLALSGCVAQRMALLVGHPVEDVIAQFGAPARVDGITAETRLYIWTKRLDLKPGPAPLSSFRDVASGDFVRARRRFARGGACEFQLLARYRPDRGRWVIAQLYDPPTQCS